jgi:hypothetical protein
MTEANDAAARRRALVFEAFLGEHRRCWRLHGKDMGTGHDDAFLCGSAVLVPLS